jgi:DNA-binding FrmR family transcriptional regulator
MLETLISSLKRHLTALEKMAEKDVSAVETDILNARDALDTAMAELIQKLQDA